MKVLTFAKVKNRLLQKSIFAKVEMVDFCKSRNGQLLQKSSGEGRSTELFWARFWFWLLQKMAKARPFFGKARKSFAKVKVKIEKKAYAYRLFFRFFIIFRIFNKTQNIIYIIIIIFWFWFGFWFWFLLFRF